MASKITVPNSISHFDIAGNDIGKLTNFYQALFGWEIASRGPGYAEVKTRDLNGALVEAPDHGLTIGVAVPDLDAALVLAATAGGKVLMEAVDNGWVRKGKICDPAGNTLTLIQS